MAFSFTHIILFLSPKKRCSVGQGFAEVKVQKKSSLIVLALIFSLHLAVIFLMLNTKTFTKLQPHEPVIVFHLLRPELSEPLQTIQPPNILHSFERAITRFPDPEPIRIEINEALSGVAKNGYELPGQRENGQQYENIFDPKMRKKLADNHHLNSRTLNSRSLNSKLKSWTDSSGTQFVGKRH
jgi:hypothetical protein